MATNRTVLITGATRGIGRELARQLHMAGFLLFVTGRDAGAVAAVRDEFSCPGCAADLKDSEAVVRLYTCAREGLGRVDVLVNNAGFNKAKDPLTSVSERDLDDAYAVNVRAPILLAREALREMGARGSGHIVNVVSSIVRASMENYSVYTTMKHALHGFTGCLIKEARRVGVKVTGVYPGGVNTRFRAQPRPDYLEPASAARMIAHCIMAPEDVVVHEILYRPLVEDNF
jgi:NAD(P)-dependent dehydrogenase (short-subunit alcohol dehydrogenase family)